MPAPCSSVAKWVELRVAALLGLSLAVCSPVPASVVDVRIHTRALAGKSVALAFDLIDGDGIANNTVTIQGFTLPGGTLGAATPTGGASGNLSGSVSLTDSTFFSEWLQEATLGTDLGFHLSLAAAFAGGPGDPPDQFSLYLLGGEAGSAGYLLPLFATTDPLGFDRLLSIDLKGDSELGVLQVFEEASSAPDATWTAAIAVPIPSAWLLMGGAWTILFTACRRRTS